MKAVYVQRGEAIDHIPASDLAAGSVVVQGKLVGITKLDIKAGVLGALALTGVFDVAKTANEAIATGAPIYWNAGDAVATASADNGLTGGDKVAYHYLGLAIADAGAADNSVSVLLNAGNL
jgi:predicted RecA/RadA family phage recombinase